MLAKKVYPSLLATLSLIGCNSGSSHQDQEGARALQAEREEAMATAINLQGHLCAKVLFVGPEVNDGERQVNCQEYRDPKKAQSKNNMVTFMIDMKNGSVRLIGRG